MSCRRECRLSLFGWKSEQWHGETDSEIAGLQTDETRDRQQVAEGKGKEKTARLFIMSVIKRMNECSRFAICIS